MITKRCTKQELCVFEMVNLAGKSHPADNKQWVAHGAVVSAAFEWLVCLPRPGERGRYPD